MRLSPAQPQLVAKPAPDKPMAVELPPSLVRSLQLRSLTALLSWRIYQDKLASSCNRPATPFADKACDLLAQGHIIGDTAIVTFRGTIGLPGLSANWRKVNLRAGWVGDPPRHCGFQEAWMRLRPQIVEWLEATRPARIVLTGHSLGAALAELAAFDLAGSHPIESVILYAPPMVGGNVFNAQYAQSSVLGSDKPLGALTQRLLMLTDAISVPLPRLLGFAPATPVSRVDRSGWIVNAVPSFAEQIGRNLVQEWVPPPCPRPTALGPQTGKADLGPPTAIDQSVGSLRHVALGYGPRGWAAYAAWAVISASARAVGFHSMKGYAIAFCKNEMALNGYLMLPDHLD